MARWPPGYIPLPILVCYGVLRFILEFLRGDQTVLWAGLTLQQLISLGVVLGGCALLLRRIPADRRSR